MTSPRLLLSLAAAAVVAMALAGCGDSGQPSTAKAGATGDKPAVKVVELGEGDQSAKLAMNLKGPLQVNFRKITLPPGSGTGKHCHHGNLIAVVDQGTLTHYAPIYPGGVHEYNSGDSIFEGSGYVHEGKNEGSDDVVLLVTYATPEGDPLAETDLARCDAS